MAQEPRTPEVVAAELAEIEAAQLSQSQGSAPDPHVAAATAKGWVPKEQFDGPASKWVDAKTFVERGERFTHNLQGEIASLRATIEGFKGTQAQFVKFHEESITKKDEEIRATIQELRIAKSRATREGEDEEAITIEDRIDLLNDQRKELKAIPEGQKPPARTPGPNMDDPVLQSWIEDDNQWFKDDPKLRDFAVELGEDLIKKGETIRGRKFLDKIRGIMEQEFPRKFAATSGGSGSSVEGGGNGSSTAAKGASGGKTERDLPAEDLALMKQFIAEGWTTKEKFLTSYFSR
jgi:hypothetical protein